MKFDLACEIFLKCCKEKEKKEREEVEVCGIECLKRGCE